MQRAIGIAADDEPESRTGEPIADRDNAATSNGSNDEALGALFENMLLPLMPWKVSAS
ncbi:hypothetical protein KFU94_37955 [Chloroflexi bacterium TSY]|nr:hypothetical protein [Chloroflexi bacterium TSY]